MEHFCLTGYFTLWLAAVDALKKCDVDTRKNVYQRIKSLLTDDFLTSGSALQMPMVLGMGMELPEKQDEKKPYILLKYAEQKYLVPMGDTPAGNARRVINTLKDFQKLADLDKEHLDKVVSRKEELAELIVNCADLFGRRFPRDTSLAIQHLAAVVFEESVGFVQPVLHGHQQLFGVGSIGETVFAVRRPHFQLVTIRHQFTAFFFQTLFQLIPVFSPGIVVGAICQNADHIHDGEVPFPRSASHATRIF